jgi:outer membrane protein TolC
MEKARDRELASRQAARAASADWLPSLVGNAVLVGTDGDENRIAAGGGLNNPIIYDRGAFGLNMSWQLYDFGRTANRVEAARLRTRAMTENIEVNRADVVLHVDEAFIDVLQALAVQGVVEKAVAARKTLRDQVQVLVANSVKTELDLALAESALAEASLLRSRAINDEASARARLGLLLGVHENLTAPLIEPELPVEEPMEATPWIQRALASRPELKRLRLEHEVALRGSRAEKAGHYPVLNAMGAGGVVPERHERLAENYFVGGFNLSFPIFEGFRTDARLREAELLAESAAKLVEAEEGKVTREVRTAVLDLANAHQRSRLAAKLREATSKAVRLAELKYSAGTVSVAETAQAQLQATAAEIGEVGARYGVHKAWTDLQYQSGRLLENAK